MTDVKYPPMANTDNHVILETISKYPFVSSQPHLFFSGAYRFVEAVDYELTSFVTENPLTLILDYNPSTDPDPDNGYYRVFVIDESEA